MSRAPRKRVLIWILLAIAAVVAVAVVALLTVPPPLERWLQARVILALREHYQTEIHLKNLHVTLIPEFQATADDFVLPTRGGDSSQPPLIAVRHFTVSGSPFELLRSPVHIGSLRLEGMEIKVGPKRKSAAPGAAAQPRHHTRLANFLIDDVRADGTMLYILHKDPTRDPMLFELRKLKLRSAGIGQPMKFTAELTNPTPPGIIDTTGNFGPWNFDEPSVTKVNGHYNFQHADLSVFNGISGILSSVGDYSGVLENILVDGTTDTPDFQLDRGGDAVHLTTQFHAIVDGTNGNTYLRPVKAHFLNSDIVTSGAVAGHPGQKGKTISLDVDITHALVQDVLALAAKSDPPLLTGAMQLQAKLELPPGNQPVLQKMKLGGRFQVTDARFTDAKMKHAIVELSRRGQGKPHDESIKNVAATFAGNFNLQSSTLHLASLHFVVPGAAAQVKGSYGVSSGDIDFVGDVRLDARASQTMTGAKRWLLVPFDPLFHKHGAGTYLPVTVGGTRQHPDLNLDWKKLF